MDILAMIWTPFNQEILIKVFLSFVVGFLIGWHRKEKAAGLRTFSLICIGSTIFTIMSIHGFSGNADPARLVANIITGIGFIGAGVIWKTQSRLSGLTTAAGIWATASIGIAIGLGMWALAVIGTILVIFIFHLRRLVPQSTDRRL